MGHIILENYFEENGEGKLKKKDVSPLPIKSGQ
jgi:hypothetical protein